MEDDVDLDCFVDDTWKTESLHESTNDSYVNSATLCLNISYACLYDIFFFTLMIYPEIIFLKVDADHFLSASKES